MKVHVRGGADYLPMSVDQDGTVHYQVDAGLQSANRAKWNFDYVVDTGVDGSHHTLDQFRFNMTITETKGDASLTDTFMFDPTSHAWIDAHGAGFGGDDFLPSALTAGATPPVSQVAENSVNVAFTQLQAFYGSLGDPTAAGTHYDDVVLQATNAGGGHVLGSVHDSFLLA